MLTNLKKCKLFVTLKHVRVLSVVTLFNFYFTAAQKRLFTEKKKNHSMFKYFIVTCKLKIQHLSDLHYASLHAGT